MVEIITKVKQKLAEKGVTDVYSAYDAIPVRDKGKYFTVLGFSGYEAENPIRTGEKMYMPIKCDLTMTVYAPMNTSQEDIYNYYNYNLETTVNSIVNLSSRLRSISISPDSKHDRMTLKAVIKLSCMKTINL